LRAFGKKFTSPALHFVGAPPFVASTLSLPPFFAFSYGTLPTTLSPLVVPKVSRNPFFFANFLNPLFSSPPIPASL
jgi:hypothetical protein